jgi:hypothetical protein
MADNTVINAGSGGDTIATDDIGGVKHQLVKVEFGAADSATQVSPLAGLPIAGSQSALSTAAWTSATALNTAASISIAGFNTVTVGLANTSTMTAGVLTFEVSPDNTNWFPIAMARIDSYTVENAYTLNVVANRAWSTSVDGWTNFRVRLSTVITGTGTANLFIIAQTMAIEPVVVAGQSDPTQLHVTPHQPQLWFEVDVPGIAAAAYSAGDQFGSLITITNAARVTGGTGWINSIVYWDDTDVMGAIDIVFFRDTLTLAADNAAFAISDADARKALWVAQLSNVNDLGAQRFIAAPGLAIPYYCTGTSLYAAIITRTANASPGTVGAQRFGIGLSRD